MSKPMLKGLALKRRRREILEHSLKGRSDHVYRNYFAADPRSEDFKACLANVECKYMVQRGAHGGLVYFHVTQAGAEAVGLRLPDE